MLLKSDPKVRCVICEEGLRSRGVSLAHKSSK